MSTENWVTAEVSAPAGVEFPGDLRLTAFYNMHTGGDGYIEIDPSGVSLELPGWSGDDGSDDSSAGDRRRWMQFWTGSYDFEVLCEGAKKLSARFPGVTVTVSIDNADEPGKSEEAYRDGQHVLTGGEGPLHTLLTTREIIQLVLDKTAPSSLLGSWADDLARRIDDGKGGPVIFKSRQVNTDPEPWVTYHEITGAPIRTAERGTRLDPRPEFNATRDPEPWESDGPIPGLRSAESHSGGSLVWRRNPRPEFDNPVNPILTYARNYLAADKSDDPIGNLIEWLKEPRWERLGWVNGQDFDALPEQIDHARRVLTRLAGWSTS